MKLLFVLFVAILGTGNSQNTLSLDLLEFINLLPPDELDEIVNRYLLMDEFIDVILYVVFDDGFKQIVLDMEKVPEYLELLKYMDESGLEVYEILKLLHESIGLPPPSIPKTAISTLKENRRNVVNQCRDEIRTIFPKDRISELHNYKMVNSSAFKYFTERLQTQELAIVMANLNANPVYQESMKTLDENGLDMVDSMDFYAELFGYKYK